MEYFLQQLINGVTLGSIYGLIAIGYTMVYGIIGMINFAHGDVFMVGGFIALIAFLALVAIGVTAIPLALFLVLLIAMALTALYGWTVERIAYRPLRHSYRLAPLISAIGMSIILQNYVQIAQGARVKPLPPLITGGHTLIKSEAFNVELSNIQIIVVVDHAGADGGVLLAGGQDAARPRHARLRAGLEDGVAARRQYRPHHLADLRASEQRSPRSPASCTCSIMA